MKTSTASAASVEDPRRPRSPRALLALMVAVGVAGCGEAPGEEEAGPAMATAPVEVEGLDDPQRLLQLAQGMILGEADAPVTILEFADYSCPHCKIFDEQVLPRLDLAYLREGRAKLVFHDFPLGSFPHSFLAARAARCAADQDRYWDYHRALFENQESWSLAAAPPVGQLVEYAATLGLDRAAFEGCVRSDRHADVVTANQRLARELNLRGTPAVLIGRPGDPIPRRVDSPSWEAIAEAVEAAGQGG